MNVSANAIVQYLLALAALVALVVLNLWGTPDTTLTGVLTAVLSTTLWGGYQHDVGLKKIPPEGN